jgi:acyl carrier protein
VTDVVTRHADEITERVLAIVEEKTGYERQYLELDLDLEADLGIDTIKQAQVMARLRDEFRIPSQQKVSIKDFPTLRHVVQYVQATLGGANDPEPRAPVSPAARPPAPVVAAPPAPVGPSTGRAPSVTLAPSPATTAARENDTDIVLGIIEAITGYEREALELDLDLEADLGIDTIKQAQVMARLRDQFNLPREQGVRVKDFPTIRHIDTSPLDGPGPRRRRSRQRRPRASATVRRIAVGSGRWLSLPPLALPAASCGWQSAERRSLSAEDPNRSIQDGRSSSQRWAPLWRPSRAACGFRHRSDRARWVLPLRALRRIRALVPADGHRPVGGAGCQWVARRAQRRSSPASR